MQNPETIFLTNLCCYYFIDAFFPLGMRVHVCNSSSHGLKQENGKLEASIGYIVRAKLAYTTQ